MRLSRLLVQNMRNIDLCSVELGPTINLFVGENGSGKTSVLESVHFLSSARSFRPAKGHTFIKQDADGCLVKGILESGQEMAVSMNKTRGRKMAAGGNVLKRTSELAHLLPVVVLGPQTINLLTGGPEYRRRFLNWGVFHVEPAFRRVWELGKRCLYQRNKLLKKPGVSFKDLASWSTEFVRLSEIIHGYRASYIRSFSRSFRERVGITGMTGVEVKYEPGWNAERPLRDELEAARALDVKRGFTSKGFHRADLAVRLSNREVSEFCSRGELKRLAWALLLVQGEKLKSEVVYLVDDLTSELDSDSRERICNYLVNSGSQVLATGVDGKDLSACWGGIEKTMFHVEHGLIKRNSI